MIVKAWRTFLGALAVASMAPLATAFPIFSAPPADNVVEYFNTATGHYFYTWSLTDQASLESGAFGAGWVRTGLGFGAYGTRERGSSPGFAFNGCAAPGDCLPITRFYAPGPNSHFFTGSASDVAMLDRPGTGWLLENVAFHARMPDAQGNCSGTTPVHRLYNNRAALNDTNHRYTASDATREHMVARGWIDEGVAFCAYGKRTSTLETHSFALTGPGDVRDIRECMSAPEPGSCLGVRNLPVPTYPFTSTSTNIERDEFDRETGMYQGEALTLAVTGGARAAAAAGSFVQIARKPLFWYVTATGIHLTAQAGSGQAYTSMTALRRMPRAGVYPYRFETGTDRELYLGPMFSVQEVSAKPGSHAYGVVTLQFTDETSGRSLLFNIVAFGTLPAGEGIGRDVHTSLPLVYATAGTNGRFGNFPVSGDILRPIAQQEYPSYGWHADRINRRHFQAILDAARQVDSLLSPRPEDYWVANFGVVNEIYGEGEIGATLSNFHLSVTGAE